MSNEQILQRKDFIFFYIEKEYWDNFIEDSDRNEFERGLQMTREEVVSNLYSTYSKHGVTKFMIEAEIDGGLAKGFSYQTIYTGLRMAMGNCFKVREYFTPAEMAEAFDTTEEEIIGQIEELERELKETGENPDNYFIKTEPEKIQRFIVLPGGLN
jgi:hypothetical protein